MIFYLGHKVNGIIKDRQRMVKNKTKSWTYGYNKELDTVIISRDGTLGEIYNIMGLNIGLPEKPKDKDILNYNVAKVSQKYTRHELPEGLNEDTMNDSKYEDFIDEEFRRRHEGLWVFIKGYPVYMTGTYYYGIQWVREEVDHPNFRIIQNELMIFWEACKADDRCYGMQYVKNRRMGASFLAIVELLEAGTISEDKLLGIVSKVGKDSSKIFRRLIKGFKRLPCFFRPPWDGTNTPKKELVLDMPTKRLKKGETINESDGLGTTIGWHNTEINAMDGDAIYRSLLDECFAKGTKILMEDFSFKNIEEINVGDKVITEGGKILEVRKTCRGYSEMFTVEQPYSKDYTVTLNHRLYLDQRCKVKGIHDDGIKITRVGDYLKLGKYKKRTTFGVRSKGLDFKEQEVDIEPRMFGVWLGDGSKDQAAISVNIRDDKETLDYLKDYCKRNNFSFREKPTHTKACVSFRIKRPKKEQHLNGKICRNKFVDALKELNVINNKRIPVKYLKNSRKVRLELLAGILDTDGSLFKRGNSYHYEITSSKEDLFQDYLKLIRSLGFKCSPRKRISNLNTEYWSTTIHGDISEIPCIVERKIVPKSFKRKYCPHINKINVVPSGYGEFYGITLDSDEELDQRLILEDFTVSLNSGKYPPDVPFSEYWYIVKTSHTKGIRITGKSMVVSTVNAMKKGGAQYKKIWDDSDIDKRDSNGETKSGLYRIFIPAKYCLEGMFDQYGFSIVEDPEKPIKTDEGKIVSTGSITFLSNKLEGLKADPEKANEFLRQFPETERDAFRDESGDCEFNLIKIQDQIDHNEFELNDSYNNEGDFNGNDDLMRGNLAWENGIQDTKVVWRPDPENGRFFIKKGCFPPEEYRNSWEEKWRNGILAKAPLAAHIGSAGVDPYNRTKTVDKRGSYGSYALTTRKEHTCDELPKNTMIVEYIARPKKVELFFEDMIMVSVFYSIPFLSEMSNDRFLAYVKDRGYRHYSLNNPFKKDSDLSTAEKEFGGAPQQDAKIRDAQAIAVESFVEDYIGIAMVSNNRGVGEMGDFPFSRTLYQLKDFDSDKRTKFDAFISFSLSLIANQKRPKKQEQEKSPVIIPFKKYNNNGLISKAY